MYQGRTWFLRSFQSNRHASLLALQPTLYTVYMQLWHTKQPCQVSFYFKTVSPVSATYPPKQKRGVTLYCIKNYWHGSIPVLKNVHINKSNGSFVAAYTVVKLLACTQTSFSSSFRHQSRIQERARSSRKKKKERLYCGHLWVKRGLLSPSHGNFVPFCWLLSPPLPHWCYVRSTVP